MRTYKRRKYYIDRKFQLKYILLVIFMLLFYTVVFVAILFVPHILPFAFNAPPEEQVKAAEILLTYHKNIWPAIFIVIPMFGILSIFITHKIAGPVYRLKKKLDEMTTGNLEGRLSLRNGDDLKDLADCVNQLSDELRIFISTLKTNYADISEDIIVLQKHIETKTLNEGTGKELMSRLEASKKSIAETLDKFNIKNSASD